MMRDRLKINSFPKYLHRRWRLSIFQVGVCLFDGVEHMALSNKEIAQAIVVGIDEVCAPSGVQKSYLADAGGVSCVRKECACYFATITA